MCQDQNYNYCMFNNCIVVELSYVSSITLVFCNSFLYSNWVNNLIIAFQWWCVVLCNALLSRDNDTWDGEFSFKYATM